MQLQLKAQSLGDKTLALRMRHLLLAIMAAESAITGPFRQVMKNAESRIAPYMGSTDVLAYAGTDTADVTATFLCLKAVVAEWERRYKEVIDEDASITDALEIEEFIENKLDVNSTGRICAAVQSMSQAFSSSKDTFELLSPEAKFIELALSVETSSEVRRIALQDICPSYNITPDEFKNLMLNMVMNIDSLPRNSYSQLQRAITELYDCLVEGTPDAYDIYMDNMFVNGPLRFETYDLVKADNQPWRQRLHKLISHRQSSDEDDQDYGAMFKAMTPDLSGIITSSEKPPLNWVIMLDDDAGKDLLQDLSITDEEESVQIFGNDIYDDFERRYGLSSEKNSEDEED
jgi:hypothetical protein